MHLFFVRLGGTQRLPRLIGVKNAVALTLKGIWARTHELHSLQLYNPRPLLNLRDLTHTIPPEL